MMKKIFLILALLAAVPAWAQVSYDFTTGSLPSGVTLTRSSVGTYTNSSGNLATASTNVARFNYISGTPYLLIEPAATNLAQYSNAFKSGGWYAANSSTVTAAQFTSPDNTNDGWSATGGSSYGGPGNAFTATAQAYTQSVWVKYITSGATFCFSGDTSHALASTVARFTYTHTFAAGSQQLLLQSCDGTSKTIGLFGVQVEAGSKATSYIPNTTSGSASRSADAASFTIPYGVHSLTVTFDDNSTQTISGLTPLTVYTIPTNLNRPNIKTITGAVTDVYPPQPNLLPATYASGLSVTLSDATSGATICYRTDGVTPTAATPGTCDSPALTYSTPLTLSSTVQLAMIATKSGSTNSSASTGTYTIKPGINYSNTDSALTTGGAQTGTQTSSVHTNPVVSATSGGATLWQLLPNAWGAGSSFTGSTTVAYPGSGSVTMTINEGSLPITPVSGYPLIAYGGDVYGDPVIGSGPIKMPISLSQMGSLIVDVAYTLTNTTAPNYQNVMFDQWLMPSLTYSGGGSGAIEVSVNTYYAGFTPPGSKVDTMAEVVLLNGVLTTISYDVYLSGSGPGAYVVFSPGTQITSGEIQFNMLDFLKEAATVAGVTGWYNAGFNYGSEYGNTATVNYSLATTKIGIQQTLLNGSDTFWMFPPY